MGLSEVVARAPPRTRMGREIDPSADWTSTDTQQSQHNQLSMPRAALPTKAPTPPSVCKRTGGATVPLLLHHRG